MRLQVNDQEHELDDVDQTTPLLWVLRDHLGLVGTKFGCGMAQCGACTVHLNGAPIRSCSVPVSAAVGQKVTTIEGLAGKDGKLHALQQGFWDQHGLQCGYCTPGMLLTAYALLKHQPNPTEADIREGLSGNLCRCTGYQNIVKAVQQAATTLGQPAGATK